MNRPNPWRYSQRVATSTDGSPFAYLMDAAMQAPSGDNCQPWKFRVSDDRLDLFLDRAADDSFFNVDQLASLTACGCAIENMKIAATATGHTAHIDLLPDGPDADWLASIALEPSSEPADPLCQVIWKRNTNRKPFQKTPVPIADLESLERVAAGDGSEETSLHLITDRQALKEVAGLVFKADRIRTENRSLHEYFMGMVRFTQRDAVDTLTGLPLPNLEAGAPGEAFLKATRSWRMMRAANGVGAGRTIAFIAQQGVLSSAGVGLLTAGPPGTQSALRGVRALARTWLTATRLGLRLQPMTAITLFWERWHRGGAKDFSKRHQTMLEGIWPKYRQLFPLEPEQHTQIMLFRFGFASDIAYGTYRKPIDRMMRPN